MNRHVVRELKDRAAEGHLLGLGPERDWKSAAGKA